MKYVKTEKINRTVNNTGDIIGYTLYISTQKGKRRKWAGERETLHDIDILIRQNYLEKEFDRVLAIVRNENINFEIQKLKSLVFSELPTQQEQAQEEESQMKADELKADDILKLLNS